MPLYDADDEAVEGDESVAQLPEPQFDFYKILPNKEVNISEWESAEEETAEPQAQNQPIMYVLQVGSFKEFQAADEIKARLQEQFEPAWVRQS